MTHSKGISWFNDCRIPHNEDLSIIREEKVLDTQNQGWGFKSVSRDNSGRFPANLLVSDDILNDGVINGGGSYTGIVIRKRKGYKLNPNSDNLYSTSPDNYGDKGSNSRYYNIDKWFDKIINYE